MDSSDEPRSDFGDLDWLRDHLKTIERTQVGEDLARKARDIIAPIHGRSGWEGWQDFVTQAGDPRDFSELWCIAIVWGNLESGSLMWADVELGVAAAQSRPECLELLAACLGPESFRDLGGEVAETGVVRTLHAKLPPLRVVEADGELMLGWRAPLPGMRGFPGARSEEIYIAPGRAPLLLGSVDGALTVSALVREGAVARWSAGATHLRIVVALDATDLDPVREARKVVPDLRA